MAPDENPATFDTFQHASYPALQIDVRVRNHLAGIDNRVIKACTLSLTNCLIEAIAITRIFNKTKVGAIGVFFELCGRGYVTNFNKAIVNALVHVAIFINGVIC